MDNSYFAVQPQRPDQKSFDHMPPRDNSYFDLLVKEQPDNSYFAQVAQAQKAVQKTQPVLKPVLKAPRVPSPLRSDLVDSAQATASNQ